MVCLSLLGAEVRVEAPKNGLFCTFGGLCLQVGIFSTIMLLYWRIFSSKGFPQKLVFCEQKENLLIKNMRLGLGEKNRKMIGVFMPFLFFMSGIVIFPKPAGRCWAAVRVYFHIIGCLVAAELFF